MHICFVVEGYPTKEDPFMPFIKNTVSEIAKCGINCSVIAPQSITRARFHHLPIRKVEWQDIIDSDTSVTIYQPFYISFSGRCRTINNWLFYIAVKYVYKKMKKDVDVIYGHFWHMGVVAGMIERSKPIFVACGESKISVNTSYNNKSIHRLLDALNGVLYVSTKSYQESTNLSLQKKTPYVVLPNAIDDSWFYKKSKIECRQKLKWKEDIFVVCFVGAFIERKGVLRLNEALKRIDNTKVYACFIGSGEQNPDYERILYKGRIPHDEISEYLSASDVFVLPTTNEGCCNAIVEALACGLPVISSKDSFNDDILNVNNSLRINSESVDEIVEALQKLIADSNFRNRLAEGAVKFSRNLTLHNRAREIIKFINENVGDGTLLW